jgi:hypothetical protein
MFHWLHMAQWIMFHMFHGYIEPVELDQWNTAKAHPICNVLQGGNLLKLAAVNEQGHRIGEDHPRARLTNHEVELIFDLHDDGNGMSITDRAYGLPQKRGQLHP